VLIAQVHACDREPQNRSRARLLGPPLGQSKTRSKIFRSIKCLYQRLAEREGFAPPLHFSDLSRAILAGSVSKYHHENYVTLQLNAGQGRNGLCAETGSAGLCAAWRVATGGMERVQPGWVAPLSRTSISATCWCRGAPEVSAPLLVADVRSLS
jgi:hypothetical protein